jgi:DNA-binding protein H-NS
MSKVKEWNMRQWLIMVVACAFVLASLDLAMAADNKDELLKKIDALEQQLKELKEQQKASGEKGSHCMKAFGREKFCKCIAENLPREVGLEQYVHTVITAKEGLSYDGLTPEQKKSVDQTLSARDKCAEKEKRGFLW